MAPAKINCLVEIFNLIPKIILKKFSKIRAIGYFLFLLIVQCSYVIFAQTQELKELPVFTVDAAKSAGSFKPINGVNGGPRINLANSFDNSEYFKLIEPPYIRLHDTPYADEGTVDIHLIFPNFNANENDPANYHFEKTDLNINMILKTGSKVIFRLGESIENGMPRYYVNPPADFKKWVRICCNIIRHYNMGWANGFKWDIQRWEIWNEPDVPACWTGTMTQYCELYQQAAIAIKKLDPALKVGGPALGGSLDSEKGREFLGFCRDNKVPLDFVSWHGYADHPDKLMKKIESGIITLKEYGFQNIETVFDEWNYNANGNWNSELREKNREAFLKTTGAPGAAFTASMLAYFLDSELDIACYYAAYGSIFRFGLFDIYGVPKKPFYAFEAYNKLMKYGSRIDAIGNNRETGLGIIAAVNTKNLTTAVLLSNFEDEASRFVLKLNNLPIADRLYCTEYVIDEVRSLEWDREQVLSSANSQLIVELPKASVRLLLFTPQALKK